MNNKRQVSKSQSIPYGFEYLVNSIDQLEQNGIIAAEFANLPGSLLFPSTVGKAEGVAKKNRCKEVVPYDHNRVILCHCDTSIIDIDGDYINASFIRGYRSEDGYIATQGPMLGTVEDFWTMVWSENTRLLVMLCRLVERCQNQSYKYWPDVGDCIDVENITVSTDMEDERGTYVIRKCVLRHTKTGEVRQVTHLQFLAWPDNCLPCLSTFVSFWKTYRKLKTLSAGPPIIHCSDSSQRTGLLIGLDSIMSQWETISDIDIFSCVLRIREDRFGVIPQESDYIYLYRAAVEAYLSIHSLLEARTVWNKDTGYFSNDAPVKVAHDDIVKEFKVLERQRQKASKTNVSMTESDLQSETSMDSSYQLLFPSDTGGTCVTCVPLQHQKKTSSCLERPSRLRHSVSLQENEIFLGIGGIVPSDCKTSFLVSAAPPSSMSADFWQIIFDTGCRTIVKLAESSYDSIQDDKWPLHTPDFSITMATQSMLMERVTESTMLMTSEIEPVTPFDCDIPSELSIRMYTLVWSRDCQVIPSCDTLFLLFKRISRWLLQTSSSLIAVQCKDGQSTSGHFCAAYNVASNLQMDGNVDIYLTAREVQDRLPLAISQDQFQHLYSLREHFLQQRHHQLGRLQSRDLNLSVQADRRSLCSLTSFPSTEQ